MEGHVPSTGLVVKDSICCTYDVQRFGPQRPGKSSVAVVVGLGILPSVRIKLEKDFPASCTGHTIFGRRPLLDACPAENVATASNLCVSNNLHRKIRAARKGRNRHGAMLGVELVIVDGKVLLLADAALFHGFGNVFMFYILKILGFLIYIWSLLAAL